MSPTALLTISATVLVAAVTPGPAATAIVARAIADGLRPALALSAGVLMGDLLFLAAAAAGMAAAAHSMGEFFMVIRWAGAAYLAWQGMALWRARPRIPSVGRAVHEGHFWRNFGAGLLLVALVLVVIIGGVNAGYALLAARARGFFADQRAMRAVNRVAGTLMFAAAAQVATRV